MSQSHQRLANRLLGYPDDARLLIVNADDLGMCLSINEAILRVSRLAAWLTRALAGAPPPPDRSPLVEPAAVAAPQRIVASIGSEYPMKHLVMYGRTSGCPFITVAKRVFNDYGLTYDEIMIDKDNEARRRVQDWTGFLAVPTIVVAEAGSILPYEEPAPLPRGDSPRGINRGSMITEPGIDGLTAWLRQHEFIPAADASSDDATSGS